MTDYPYNHPLCPETEEFICWYNSQMQQGLLGAESFLGSAVMPELEWQLTYAAWKGGRRFNQSLLPADLQREKLQHLAATWREDVRFLSDTNEICGHPAYQRIIGMGLAALPFIFEELEREPENWFWALKAITGQDPVLEEHRGNAVLMAQDWLSWWATGGERSEAAEIGSRVHF